MFTNITVAGIQQPQDSLLLEPVSLSCIEVQEMGVLYVNNTPIDTT